MQTYAIYSEDTDGDKARTSLYLEDTATIDDVDVAAIITAMEGVSTARLYKHGLDHREEIAGDSASAGPYDIRDKVTFEFSTDDGRIYKMNVPAPDAAIFSDSDNVDLTHAAVLALETAAIALLRAPGDPDAALVDLLRGYRTRRERTR